MSSNESSKERPAVPSAKRVPDAWNDDDWEKLADNVTEEATNITKPPETQSATAGAPTILLRKSIAPSKTSAVEENKVDDLVSDVDNLQVWNNANSTEGFEVVPSGSQTAKTIYKPELKILKRNPSSSSSPGVRTPQPPPGDKNEMQDESGEITKETQQEKLERERKEREIRYAKARERLFGPAENGTGAAATSSVDNKNGPNGRNSGSSTPTGSGAKSQTSNAQLTGQHSKFTPPRRSSPTPKQTRRREVDDDFVPRSQMIAGTLESYQRDQQMVAEARMREQSQHHQQAMFPQYNHGQPNMSGVGHAYNNHAQNNFQQGVAYNGPWKPQGHGQGQGQGQGQRNPWEQPIQTSMQHQPPLQHHQAQNSQQFHHQIPHGQMYPQHSSVQPQPQQVFSPPQFNPPFVPPTSQAQNYQNPQYQQLYDPLNPSTKQLRPQDQQQQQQQQHQQLQQHYQSVTSPEQHIPIREPRIPDGSGRGGFGFSNRGGNSSAMKMSGSRTAQVSMDQRSGFNSPAAQAPWAANNMQNTGPPQGANIWNNQTHGFVPNPRFPQGPNSPATAVGGGVWSNTSRQGNEWGWTDQTPYFQGRGSGYPRGG